MTSTPPVPTSRSLGTRTLSRRRLLISAGVLTGGTVVGAASLLPGSAGASGLKGALLASASPLPDLIITALVIPASLSAGKPVIFGATVKNKGFGPTPAGVMVRVAFHIDSGPQVTWSTTDLSSLGAGASITLYATGGRTGTAAWTAVAGSHTLRATVNNPAVIAETTTMNNSRSAAFTVSASSAPTPPVNTALPVITGSPVVGDVLTVSNGSWS
jgi:subtilase family serine protease